jgi:hypothetical protein
MQQSVSTQARFNAAVVERRKGLRRPLATTAIVSVALRQPLLYRARDLGEDGLSILGTISLVPGTRGLVRFTLPGRTKDQMDVELAAIVVNRMATGNGYRLGLQYKQVGTVAWDSIQTFLESAPLASPLCSEFHD